MTERQRQAKFPPIEPIPNVSDAPQSTELGLVSATQFLHPLTKDGKKLLDKARADLKSGDREHAMERLHKALLDPGAAPYAHGILGTEYLRQRDFPLAINELRQASHSLPGDEPAHSNLAYALYLNGEFPEAELEARRAISLNPESPQPNFILGLTLLSVNAHSQEAVSRLRQAQDKIPAAARILARLQPGPSN